jgi:rubrerythrin
MRVGSLEHRDLLCWTFLDTHTAFEPESLAWPKLEQRHIDLLRSFPFWAFALSLEQEAGRMITVFAETIEDPLIRKAIDLQAYEETRHSRLLKHMLERYGIETPAVPLTNKPVDREDFVTFGFGECNDSFIGFSAFAIAREKRIFPQELLDIIEIIMHEEARHIAFFINWWRYEEERAGRTNPFTRAFRAIRYQVRALMHTAQGAQGSQTATLDLTGGGSAEILAGITPKRFLEIGLTENRIRMSRLDRRLLKPRLIPNVALAVVLGLRMLPPLPAAEAATTAPQKPSLVA